MKSVQALLGAPLLFGALCVSCAEDGVKLSNSREESWTGKRAAMVDQLRAEYRIKDEAVLAAMAKARRHVYIPERHRRDDAYGDHPCAIGYGQTVSQPFIVAYMTAAMKIAAGEKVLEIGTGSGYQAAILAELRADVYSIEIVPELAEHARAVLKAEGYNGVRVLAGDGHKGWPQHAPFDAIVVTCAPEEVPQALVDQLKEGGRMILPLGSRVQQLVILRKKGGKIQKEEDIMVRFVPMTRGKDEPLARTNSPPVLQGK
ncbi:MAG: protein-L-isoaspartate(D-aspartate) O-methyltransferase [Verrucomicrobiota bacterium]|nr:protein-L-isoaspartate(D-aspartate) O-methyltransferase [Verrucomicrobiota bacterium]